MSKLLPFRTESGGTPDEPRVLDLEDADETFSALSSATTREILSLIYEQSRTPTEIRDEIDTSLQNVHYHLEKLEDAELIEPSGTGYSEKGKEMTVYAPASKALVLFAGNERDRSLLKDALTRLLTGVGILAFATLALRTAFDRLGTNSVDSVSNSGEADPDVTYLSADSTPTSVETATPSSTETATVAQANEAAPGAATQGGATGAGPGSATATSGPSGESGGGAYKSVDNGISNTVGPDSSDTFSTNPSTADDGGVYCGVANENCGPDTELNNGGAVRGDGTIETAQQGPLDAAVQAPIEVLQDPVVAFFVGGLFVLSIVVLWWTYRDSRRDS